MHAVVVDVTIDDEDTAMAGLRDRIVPTVSGAPGFVAGYWTRSGNSGFGMTVWESEDAANAAAQQVRSGGVADGVTFNSVNVREVVASA
jgi:heme-degrading monooxygenase HmoA